jgi:hypothetical protein
VEAGYEAQTGVATYYPGIANPADAQLIDVALGQDAQASFQLVGSSASRISGVVHTSSGQPAGNMQVMLRETLESEQESFRLLGQTGPDGSFSADGVPPGNHIIEVRSSPVLSSHQSEFGSLAVATNGEDVADLFITTGRGAIVTGQVRLEGRTDRVAHGGSITIMPYSADPAIPMMAVATSPGNGLVDESGRFEIRGVNGSVVFRARTSMGWSVKAVTLNGIDVTDLPFDAKPGMTVTGMEVVLSNQQTRLTGIVHDSRGNPIKDYALVIFPNEIRPGTIATRFIKSVRPDQEGRYETRGLPAGTYLAAVVESLEQGAEWDPVFRRQIRDRAQRFSLSEGQNLSLDLQLTR